MAPNLYGNNASAAEQEAKSTSRSRRRAGKSSSAFRTISEVAGELDVQQHVLRFWESKFSQVKPLKRGGGRRYYRPEDVELLKRIHNLLYTDGYTIKGVQKLLQKHPKGIIPAAETASAPTEKPAPASTTLQDKVSEHKTELQDLLGDLKDMRGLLNA